MKSKLDLSTRSQTSTVELNGAMQLDDGGRIATSHAIIELLESLVIVADVRVVVQHHDFAADDRLQRSIVVRKVRGREGLKASSGEESSTTLDEGARAFPEMSLRSAISASFEKRLAEEDDERMKEARIDASTKHHAKLARTGGHVFARDERPAT